MVPVQCFKTYYSLACNAHNYGGLSASSWPCKCIVGKREVCATFEAIEKTIDRDLKWGLFL